MRTQYPRSRGRIALRLLAASALMTGLMPPSRPGSEAASPAAESYYMVVYAAQEESTPLTSHCFATFARVTSTGRPSDEPRIELHHINWFSVRGHQSGQTYGVFENDGRLTCPEPGENRTTREALELVLRRGLRVSRFGPFEIDRDLFERALRQIERLEGRIPGARPLYKAFDLGYREGSEIRALNCIHAISDIVREPIPLRTWACYGDEAARRVVLHLRRAIKDPAAERPSVWEAIWRATWQGAPEWPAGRIVRADLESRPGPEARQGRTEDTTGALTMRRAPVSDSGQVGRGSGSTAAAGGG
jgi:hypothetical protein